MGVDPGLNHTGFGVIDVYGNELKFVTAGVINVPKGELAERLRFIFTEVGKIARETTPSFAACEKVFVNMNPYTTLLLGQARGAALTALANEEIQADAADALACAVCAAQSFRMMGAMQAPKTSAGHARRHSGAKNRAAWEVHLGLARKP